MQFLLQLHLRPNGSSSSYNDIARTPAGPAPALAPVPAPVLAPAPVSCCCDNNTAPAPVPDAVRAPAPVDILIISEFTIARLHVGLYK